jgi:hypothetical protein
MWKPSPPFLRHQHGIIGGGGGGHKVIQSAEVNFYVLQTWILVEMHFQIGTIVQWSRGSSDSIVSDYGLDDRGSIPDRGRGFFF